MENELKELLIKIIKAGLVYFIVIQVFVLVCAFFLPMPIIPLMRFVFTDIGVVRETAENTVMILIELLIRFLVFLSFFKNDRRLTFKQFCLNYSVTFVLRLIFSMTTHFAGWSVGIGVSLTGSTMGVSFIDENIKTMQDVPMWFYIVIFVFFEALTILVAFLSSRLAAYGRNKIKKELQSGEQK